MLTDGGSAEAVGATGVGAVSVTTGAAAFGTLWRAGVANNATSAPAAKAAKPTSTHNRSPAGAPSPRRLVLRHRPAKLFDLPAATNDNGLLGALGATTATALLRRRCGGAGRRPVRNHDRTRFFRDLNARLWHVRALLVRNDRIVAKLF